MEGTYSKVNRDGQMVDALHQEGLPFVETAISQSRVRSGLDFCCGLGFPP